MRIPTVIPRINQSVVPSNQEETLVSAREHLKADDSPQTNTHTSSKGTLADSAAVSGLMTGASLSQKRLQKAVQNLRERPNGITTIDLSQSISVEIKKDKKKSMRLVLSGDPQLVRTLGRAMPSQILTTANKAEVNGKKLPFEQQQSILLHQTGTQDAGLKAIMRQADGSIAVLTHSQALPMVNSKKASHSALIMQDETVSLKSSDKRNSTRTRVDLPTSTHVNALNSVHEAGDGRLLKVVGNQVHQFNQEDKTWQPTTNGGNVQQLLNGPNGEVYQMSRGDLANTRQDGPEINISMLEGVLRHITEEGKAIGLQETTEGSRLLLASNITDGQVSSIALPSLGKVLDAISVGNEVWLSIEQQDEQGKATGSALYRAPIIENDKGLDLGELSQVSLPTMGPELAGYRVKEFVPSQDAQNTMFVRLSKDDQEHLAVFNPDTGEIGRTDTVDKPSSWLISEFMLLENHAGIAKPEVTQSETLPNGIKLELIDGALYQKDAASGELHATPFDKGVDSIATDASGTTVYALVSGRVKALSITPPQQHFSMSAQETTSLANSNGSKVSTHTSFPITDTYTFAAASPQLLVSIGSESGLMAVVSGKKVDLNALSTLPDDDAIKNIAFDKSNNLYAQSESGKVYQLPAKVLEAHVQGGDSGDEHNGWQALELPKNSQQQELKLLSIKSGAEVDVLLESESGYPRTYTLDENSQLTPKTKAQYSAFEQYAMRDNTGSVGRAHGHVHGSNAPFMEKVLDVTGNPVVNPETGKSMMKPVIDSKTGDVVTNNTLHQYQSVKSRLANAGAHVLDAPVHAMQKLGRSIKRRATGTSFTRDIAQAAQKNHADFLLLNQRLVNNAKAQGSDKKEAPAENISQRLASVAQHAPQTAKALQAVQELLLNELNKTLTSAGIERGVVDGQTGHPKVNSSHVGKERYGDDNILNALSKLLAQSNIDSGDRVESLLKAFDDSNQGLKSKAPINPAQPHSLRPLQITKEHLELIAVQLDQINTLLGQAESLKDKTESDKSSGDIQLLKKVKELQHSYEGNPVTKANQEGYNSYSQVLGKEALMANMISALERRGSGLSRALRSKLGVKNHEDALKVMQEVAKTIPAGATLHIGQGINTAGGYSALRIGLPQNQLIQLSTFFELEGSARIDDKMRMSVSPNGDLHVHLLNTKGAEVTAISNFGAAFGNGYELLNAGSAPDKTRPIAAQIGSEDAEDRGRLRILARFNVWLESAVSASQGKGGTLVIPVDKKEAFINHLFGKDNKQAMSQLLAKGTTEKASSMLQMASSTTNVTETKVNASVGGYSSLALRAYADIDVNFLKFDRDTQPYIRFHAEIEGRFKLLEADYAHMVEQGRDSYSEKATDQLVHLLPEAYVRARVAEIHSVNLQDGDRFIYGGTPGTAENGGTGITENYLDVVNMPWQHKFDNLTLDNKRITAFDGSAATAGEIGKADYLNAMQELGAVFKNTDPNFARHIITAMEAVDNDEVNFATIARPVINQAANLLNEYREAKKNNSEGEPLLNAQQLAAVNKINMLDIHNQAHKSKATIQNTVQHTMQVSNFTLLQDDSAINAFAQNTLSFGPKVDGTSHIAQLMEQSPDLRNVLKEAAAVGESAVLKMGFHPDVKNILDELASKGELTESILDDFRMGKLNSFDDNGKPIFDKAAVGKTLVPIEIDVTNEKMRRRNGDTQTPYIRIGGQSNIGHSFKPMVITFNYESGKPQAQSFDVVRDKKMPVEERLAMEALEQASVDVSTKPTQVRATPLISPEPTLLENSEATVSEMDQESVAGPEEFSSSDEEWLSAQGSVVDPEESSNSDEEWLSAQGVELEEQAKPEARNVSDRYVSPKISKLAENFGGVVGSTLSKD